jgi:membrane protein DedA with SNARE-associated domain
MSDFLLNHGSYLGIIVFLILTGAGLPFPEEVAIVAAGVLSSPGIRHLNPWLAWASCLFGALAGDCVMYWIGHHFGRRVLREHHWWTRFIKPEREAQMERMLEDHGFKVLFLARFLVGIRSPVYLSAGILRMPFWRFMLIDLFCATAVISTFFGLSYFIGERVYTWINRGQWTLTVIVGVAVASVAIYLWRRHKRRVAAQSAEDGAGPAPDGEAGKPISGSGPRQPAP